MNHRSYRLPHSLYNKHIVLLLDSILSQHSYHAHVTEVQLILFLLIDGIQIFYDKIIKDYGASHKCNTQ